MRIKNCRVCNNKLFPEPLLILNNMPKRAQYLPTKSELKKDKGINLRIYQCSGCGLVQLDSSPVSYYREVIRAVGLSKEMVQFRKKQFKDFVDKFSLKGKKIIEIGCGRGEYLSILSSCGVKAYGLEYSKDAVNYCKKNNLKVFSGFINRENYRIKNSPFDAFFIFSFLEHLPKPNIVFRGIYNNLKEEAVGLVEVPNFDMILEKKLFSEFIGDHLFYFTQDTLKMTLKLNGFEVIDCKEIWHRYIISAIVKKRKRINLLDFYMHKQQLKKDLDNYLKQFKKVAIWGAGHQALALISLLGLKNKITYIVDSAPFKQGRFTPATHIPIVSPETLKTNPVETIMVMAGSYSNEVVRILTKKFSKNISIFVMNGDEIKKIKSC